MRGGGGEGEGPGFSPGMVSASVTLNQPPVYCVFAVYCVNVHNRRWARSSGPYGFPDCANKFLRPCMASLIDGQSVALAVHLRDGCF